jgi:diaminohydroxyphosphoribosylaminopyrimidine deaminase/5-amino-6-(5-phosphoribosylamino)uracil reductase
LGVTLKLATSLDGRIATASGESRWITGEAARATVHRLRSQHDAVLVGIETALADDPELTVRLPGYTGRQPARVVLDSRGRLPATSKLARTASEVATYVVTLKGAPAPAGVSHVEVIPGEDGRAALGPALDALRSKELAKVFVEGGGQVAASFLRAGLVDRIEWFRAPILLGSEGRPCLGALESGRLADAPRFRRVALEALGEDVWERYERV